MSSSIIRVALSFLAIIYSSAIDAYLSLYKIGLKKSEKLSVPVVCVGNLTTGGTGKTPTTIAICKLLLAQGKRPAIILRGYGGANEYGCAVVSDGKRKLLAVSESGDEAQLLANALPEVPVIVGKDRIRSGKLAIERFAPDVIVMDDGFQHWRLHRDLDIALLNSVAPFDNGWTVPRGMLRESKKGLNRAQIVLLTNSHRAGPKQVEAVKNQVTRLAPNAKVFLSELTVSGVKQSVSGEMCNLDTVKQNKFAAFSAIGNPASFEHLLEEIGLKLVKCFRYRDHETLNLSEMLTLSSEAKAAGADAIITTEKDYVKLPEFKSDLPNYILEVEMKIECESEFIQRVGEEIGWNDA